MRSILLLLLLVPSSLSFGQNAFYRIFSDNGADMAQGVVQLSDSNYVVTGSSSSFYDGPSQAFLMKLDPQGNLIWSNHYGGPESESGRRVLHRDGLGFFICGLTNSIGSGGYDFYLAKVNENAVLEWEKSYGGSGWEKVNDAVLASDNSIVMVGSSSSNDLDEMNRYAVRTDQSGDTIWTRTWEGVGSDYFTSIQAISDSSFLVGGTVFNPDSSLTKGFLAGMDLDGNLTWTAEFGLNGAYDLADFCIRQNQIIAVGRRFTTPTDQDACYFLSDMNGTQTGETVYPGDTGDETYDLITPFADSTDIYIISSYTNAWSSPNGPDFEITRYNVPVNSQYEYIVYHENPDVPGEIIPTLDGGVLVVGYSTGAFYGYNDALVIKIGPNDSVPDPDEWFGGIVAVSVLDAPMKATLFPNPSDASCTVLAPSPEYDHLRLIDMQGIMILEEDISTDEDLPTNNLENGVYFVELSGNRVPSILQKLVVQH